MGSIAAALLTATETRLTSTAGAPDDSRLAELTAPAALQVSAVERVLPEDREISEQVIVQVAEPEQAIVQVAEPAGVAARERGTAPAAARVWALDPAPV
jgi:hypothetical protein